MVRLDSVLKKIGIAGAAVLLLLAAACAPKGHNDKSQRIIPVVAGEVTKGDIVQKIILNGEIKGQNQADIYPDVPGKVLNFLVKEGQFVYRDQVVATVDRSQVGMVYMPASVRSPISGVIGKIYVDQGQTVTPQTPMMMVADTRFVEGVLHIPEKYVPLFRIGQEAEIRTESWPGEVFKGRVYKVASMIDPNTRTLDVRLQLLNLQGRLIPGNYADFTVLARTFAGQVLAPFDSVIDNLETTQVFVIEEQEVKDKPADPKAPAKALKPDGKNPDKTKPVKIHVARVRTVVVGIRDGNIVQIVSGLAPGDKVVTLGKENLIDGSLLKLKTMESTNTAPAQGGGRQ